MNIDVSDIQQRIAERLASGATTLFWEDESGEYREALAGIELGAATGVIDATGRELFAKREVLRDNPASSWVVYRAGGAPDPNDDFLYDIKLSAQPFTCRAEGIWADECGIPPALAGALSQHVKFFNSKDRRSRLAQTALPKLTSDEVRLAMLAACAKVRASAPRDAVRDIVGKLLAEHARGTEATLKSIAECGLQAALWSHIETVLGYSAPDGEDPTVADLSYRMLQTHCAALWPSANGLLSNDAIRILDALSSDSRTRADFEQLVEEHRSAMSSALKSADIELEELLGADTLPDFDEWILEALLARLSNGSLSVEDASDAVERRRHTQWFGRYENHYECVRSAAAMACLIAAFDGETSLQPAAKDVFDAYCSRWYEIDLGYRKFQAARKSLPSGRFKRALESATAEICSGYDRFLVSLTDRWQLHLLDDGAYPPSSLPAQSSFFHDKVQLEFPKAEPDRRIGVIVSDAFRYEVGAELSARINDGSLKPLSKKAAATIEGMACMLPSYTQLGMAALLPQGGMEIDPSSENVLKAGAPTDGIENRQRAVGSAVEGAVLMKAADVLENGVQGADAAPVVMIYHNVIDKRGDNRETETEVFAACEQAIEEVARMAMDLLRAGCGKVLVTADHGFLYQAKELEQFNYATVEGLHELASSGLGLMSHSRRFAVGHAIPESDMLIEYSALDLSLEGNYKVALPKGITRLRLRGSGARYVHGGASLQENAVPVVTIVPKKHGAGMAQTGVQGFLCGRAVITGPAVSLDVYQTKPCSDKVASLTVKVGLYDPADPTRLLSAMEKTMELASTAESSEDRKTRVTLPVVNDVDDCDRATLRISARIGSTNQYREEWKQELSVNRAFGNDFDF